MLIKIRWLRVVSPPASAQSRNFAARRNPRRKPFSHVPLVAPGSARFSRKHRGVPPIAAISLAARARHFQPTLSGGCFSRRKCELSRNQSLVRMLANPGFGFQRAASSPIPKRSPRPLPGRKCRAISLTNASSSRKFFIFNRHPSAPCPFGQGCSFPALYQIMKNTGLTRQSAKTKIHTVADQGSRFRSVE